MVTLLALISMLVVLVPDVAPASGCLVSQPNLTTPDGAPDPARSFGWYGTNSLAAVIPIDGHWVGMGPDRGYSDKFWWWKREYSVRNEPMPDLEVVATRTDAESDVVTPHVTNAFRAYSDYQESWDAILVGMEFTSAGCWKVVGTTSEAELTIFLRVGSEP
jgi:hypothetical protein